MRILLLTQFYPPVIGGEERHVRNLGAALAARGHEVSVGTQPTPGASEGGLDGAVRVHRLQGTLQRLTGLHTDLVRPHAPPFPDPELTLSLRQLIAREQPNIVHAHNWLFASYLPLKRSRGPRLVVTLHDYSLICAKKNFMFGGTQLCDGPGFPKCLGCSTKHYGAAKALFTTLGVFAARRAARHTVDRVIAVSRSVARHSQLDSDGLSYEVIPNFVPDDVGALGPEDPCLAALPREPFILFVGDLMRLKGIEILREAYGRLANAPPMVLIGRQFSETPDRFPPNVHVFHSWPHGAVMHAWKRCLFGVLPSTGPEACATVIMEAMASGKAVVASDIGGNSDLVEPDGTGLLVPPGDASALAAAMQRLIDEPVLRARLETLSRLRVRGMMAGAVVSRIELVYEAVLHARLPALPGASLCS